MEENKTKPYTPNKAVPNIKTYMSDMADAVRENEGSVIKINGRTEKTRTRKYL